MNKYLKSDVIDTLTAAKWEIEWLTSMVKTYARINLTSPRGVLSTIEKTIKKVGKA